MAIVKSCFTIVLYGYSNFFAFEAVMKNGVINETILQSTLMLSQIKN